MSFETYLAFVLFVIVMTGTPGAGNLTMMAIGQNTGYRSSLPFLAGMVAGMICLNTMSSLGLGSLLLASPNIAGAMKIGGMAYIVYLGWKILTMQLADTSTEKRFTFLEGCILHPTNPKSWAMSVVGFSQVATPELSLSQQMLIFIPTFVVAQLIFHSLWGVAGSMIMRTLKSRRVLLGLNSVLVTVMIGATVYALFMGPA